MRALPQEYYRTPGSGHYQNEQLKIILDKKVKYRERMKELGYDVSKLSKEIIKIKGMCV